jgi:hypothetical protein
MTCAARGAVDNPSMAVLSREPFEWLSSCLEQDMAPSAPAS